jgi:hypothetical protein
MSTYFKLSAKPGIFMIFSHFATSIISSPVSCFGVADGTASAPELANLD